MTTANISQADCLDYLAVVPDDTYDLVLCSPPYEAARTYGIDFKLQGQEWVDWAVARYLECVRTCKGLVVWVVEGQTRKFRWSATPALMMADLHRKGVKLRKPPVYRRYGIPGSGRKEWLRNDYEFCVAATKGRLPWSDNTALGGPPKYPPGGDMSYRNTDGVRRNSIVHTKRSANGRMQVQTYHPPNKCNPGNVITCQVGGGRLGSLLAHENEAPYPEALCDFFIRSFCPPGGLVFDPFSGSGTTAAAAIKAGRHFEGTDIRDTQVALTQRRIVEAQALGTLPPVTLIPAAVTSAVEKTEKNTELFLAT